MYYPGWILVYVVASVVSSFLGIPYPIALLLIVLTWIFRDRLDLPALRHLLAGASALRDAEREAEVNPSNADAQFQAGSILVDKGREAEAVPRLRAALERMGGSAEAHYLLGKALLRAEGGRAAEPHLRRALELDPRFRQGDAHLRLAEALAADGRPGEAYQVLSGFFGEGTMRVEALTAMGLAARAAGREAEAVRAFTSAKQAFKTNPPFRRRQDRVWVMQARRALGERVVADKLVVALLLAAGMAYYLWRLLR